jgi:hypothetical protein
LRWAWAGLIFFFVASAAYAEDRIALVIGNAVYARENGAYSLRNPVNDARLIADRLAAAHFKMSSDSPLSNLTQGRFEKAVEKFIASITPDTVALVYYAGHGGAIGGENFLNPIDALFDSDEAMRRTSINVTELLRQMQAKSPKLSILLLDACRTAGTRSREFGGPSRTSFAPMLSNPGMGLGATFISYATRFGGSAFDVPLVGDANHSPYARALADVIEMPGLTLEQSLVQIGRRVSGPPTDGKQITHNEFSGLSFDFYFTSPRIAPAPPPVPPPSRPAPAVSDGPTPRTVNPAPRLRAQAKSRNGDGRCRHRVFTVGMTEPICVY